MKKKIIVASVIVVLLVAAYFIFSTDHSKKLALIERDVFVVSLERAEKRDIKKEVFLSGSIKALEEAVLYPRAEGKLQRNLLKEGDAVQKNQTVSLMERDEVGAVYEPVQVPSTIKGIVGKIYLDAGEHAYKNTAIAFIVNQTKVRVILDVPERYSGQLFKGQKATFTVDSLTGKDFGAVVNIISPVVDTLSRTLRVELLSDNKNAFLKSGMFARVTIILEEKQGALSLLNQNIFTSEDNSKFVFVQEDKKAVKKTIKTGFSNDKYTEVVGGLVNGEEVIEATFGLKEGSKISVQ